MGWRLYTLEQISTFTTSINVQGYVLCYPPGGGRYTAKWEFQHRLIAESIIGRRLTSKEDVHHKDEVKTNNVPSNLEVRSKPEHGRIHAPLLGIFVPCAVCDSLYYRRPSDERRKRLACSRKCSRQLPGSLAAQARNLKPPSFQDLCDRGHPLSGENLRIMIRRDGSEERICRICVRIRNRKAKAKKRLTIQT